MRSATRYVAYNRHRLMPRLDLPARVAWYLSWRAHRESRTIPQVVETILSESIERSIAELSAAELSSLVRSIPFHQPLYVAPLAQEASVPPPG